jgi:hypothetical protein
VLQRRYLMQQLMGRLEPGFGGGGILEHAEREADRLQQAIQALRNRGFQGAFLAHTPRQRCLRHRQQRFELGKPQMQVFAQGDQPAAAPSPLNGLKALLLAQLSLINGALPEGPVTISGIQPNRGSDHHTKSCRESMSHQLKAA